MNQFHYANVLNDEELCIQSDLDDCSYHQEVSTVKICNWNPHIHNDYLNKRKSRDFHKIVLLIYESLPVEDKNDEEIIKKMNYYINKWHYSPSEVWSTIWENFGYYLESRFPPNDYPMIVKIFNCI